MNYLLDTCIISELIKPKPLPTFVDWIRTIDEDHQFISSLTIGEIQKGISKLPGSGKRRELQIWMDTELMERFENRIIDIDRKVAQTWGETLALSENKGYKMPIIDSLIAATGITYDLIVVTRNTDDMKRSGVKLFNPWKDIRSQRE